MIGGNYTPSLQTLWPRRILRALACGALGLAVGAVVWIVREPQHWRGAVTLAWIPADPPASAAAPFGAGHAASRPTSSTATPANGPANFSAPAGGPAVNPDLFAARRLGASASAHGPFPEFIPGDREAAFDLYTRLRLAMRRPIGAHSVHGGATRALAPAPKPDAIRLKEELARFAPTREIVWGGDYPLIGSVRPARIEITLEDWIETLDWPSLLFLALDGSGSGSGSADGLGFGVSTSASASGAASASMSALARPDAFVPLDPFDPAAEFSLPAPGDRRVVCLMESRPRALGGIAAERGNGDSTPPWVIEARRRLAARVRAEIGHPGDGGFGPDAVRLVIEDLDALPRLAAAHLLSDALAGDPRTPAFWRRAFEGLRFPDPAHGAEGLRRVSFEWQLSTGPVAPSGARAAVRLNAHTRALPGVLAQLAAATALHRAELHEDARMATRPDPTTTAPFPPPPPLTGPAARPGFSPSSPSGPSASAETSGVAGRVAPAESDSGATGSSAMSGRTAGTGASSSLSSNPAAPVAGGVADQSNAAVARAEADYEALREKLEAALADTQALSADLYAAEENLRSFAQKRRERLLEPPASRPVPAELARLREQRAQKTAERASWLKTCTEQHPLVVRLDREITGIDEALLSIEKQWADEAPRAEHAAALAAMEAEVKNLALRADQLRADRRLRQDSARALRVELAAAERRLAEVRRIRTDSLAAVAAGLGGYGGEGVGRPRRFAAAGAATGTTPATATVLPSADSPRRRRIAGELVRHAPPGPGALSFAPRAPFPDEIPFGRWTLAGDARLLRVKSQPWPWWLILGSTGFLIGYCWEWCRERFGVLQSDGNAAAAQLGLPLLAAIPAYDQSPAFWRSVPGSAGRVKRKGREADFEPAPVDRTPPPPLRKRRPRKALPRRLRPRAALMVPLLAASALLLWWEPWSAEELSLPAQWPATLRSDEPAPSAKRPDAIEHARRVEPDESVGREASSAAASASGPAFGAGAAESGLSKNKREIAIHDPLLDLLP